MEPRSIPRGIEKAMEKWKAPRWLKSRNKAQQRPAPTSVQSPGEGVGGGVNPSPKGEGEGLRPDTLR